VTEWLAPQRRDGIKVLRICDRYAKGYSDLFLCVQGVFTIIELKTVDGECTPHQTLFIKEMLECGAVGGVCRSLQQVAEIIEEAKLRAGANREE